jgi:hypothetical protein
MIKTFIGTLALKKLLSMLFVFVEEVNILKGLIRR